MESIRTVKGLLQKGDWLDLKDAYFTVPITLHSKNISDSSGRARHGNSKSSHWSEQPSIHLKTHEAGSVHTEEARNQINPLPGQYADNGKKQRGSKKTFSHSNGATGGSRVYNQPEEEHSHTNTGVGISLFPAEFPQHDHWTTNS